MLSAQINEKERREGVAADESQRNVRQADPLPVEPKGSSARKWIVALVIVAVVGAAVWKIRRNAREQNGVQMMMAAQADRPSSVQVSAVQQKTMPIFLTALGTVTAYNTVTIKSRVDGQLMQVPVREGQAVRQGQTLAEIDPKPYQAALEQAQGQLVKDQANAVNARAEAARYEALLSAGVVSKESQQAQASTAGQAEGSIASDRAAIEAAKVNLGYTKILSPINGVVGLRQVDAGNIVHAADTNGLLVVTQLQPIAVIFTLPEDQLPEVLRKTRAGDRLVVEAYDRAAATHLASGSLLTVDNQIDTTTGTVKAKAVFENKDGALFPNQFVNVRLILQEKRNAVVIPASALQTGTQGNFVYLLKQGQPPPDPLAKKNVDGPTIELPENQTNFYVAAQTVNVELTEGTQVILSGGVKPGDQIVVDGQEKLKNGSKVFPKTAPVKAGDGTTAELGRTSNVGQPS
ncbi:efflux RND transporter periplasmic adaptor subunit [Tunturiibacter gelidoferens]|uniref:Multidrug efflux system membrane fusion protein n=1 Tax=Tunturiibacter gelidiferens TaxID=3069689 RepID=A0ACC5P2T5_9BACT|nr:efflux RND transporter periplasmic adaptor subunit [Edaphobacter lichenicola]MBB5341095.1 multidrug efflux system membrane fusion protein [Edaphobacter lichenicola]